MIRRLEPALQLVSILSPHHLDARALALTFSLAPPVCLFFAGQQKSLWRIDNANMFASQQQAEQEKMKSTGTKTTNPPLSPQPQPSQQAAKARYLPPSRYPTKKQP
jgi:hypothetical protein